MFNSDFFNDKECDIIPCVIFEKNYHLRFINAYAFCNFIFAFFLPYIYSESCPHDKTIKQHTIYDNQNK